ncbi:LptF/LptG family permease [Qipengyuania sp. YG27]|uniref:LptF/LptG family permease n=1 Tax=Qipengyuania mesophila TaxID=2867246 RepID=A0ABS7JX52_9SPHN|nr:LptF/LptG family permease [Qipengyuania mesophila]MBX7502169.1 LptF/LptG family permease [Qipengyuania mesophila]
MLDLYLLRLSCGTLGSVMAIVMSLMVLEHLPRLIDITSLSGHRGYIVGQTILGLLPEYAGIGLIFGLFLSIALMIRKLALRGELDAIEAMGVSPHRWLRMPLLLTLLSALFVLLNQAWLMPAGERRIDEIGRRMAVGEFGYNLAANEFHAMADDVVLRFAGIDPDDGSLMGVFIRSREGTFEAASGRLSLSDRRDVVLALRNGQFIEPGGRVMSFAAIDVRIPSRRRLDAGPTLQEVPSRGVPLQTLIVSGTPSDLRVVFARLMWVVLTVLVPFIALALARPPLRSTSALGVFIGTCLIVVLIKSIDWYSGHYSDHATSEAALIIAIWLAGTAIVVLKLECRDILAQAIPRTKRVLHVYAAKRRRYLQSS